MFSADGYSRQTDSLFSENLKGLNQDEAIAKADNDDLDDKLNDKSLFNANTLNADFADKERSNVSDSPSCFQCKNCTSCTKEPTQGQIRNMFAPNALYKHEKPSDELKKIKTRLKYDKPTTSQKRQIPLQEGKGRSSTRKTNSKRTKSKGKVKKVKSKTSKSTKSNKAKKGKPKSQNKKKKKTVKKRK